MKRSHEDTDIYVGRRPGPPPGLSGTHPPTGMPVHNPGFQHPVLAPPPGQLTHSFEQMRDTIPRPPFSSPHLPATSPHLPATSPHLPATSPHLPATSPHLSATSPHLSATSPHLPATSPRFPATSPHLPTAPISNPQQPVASSHPAVKPAYQTHLTTPNSSHATAVGQQQQQYQRLKVEDALSYLDQVKLQFGNQPQVYNEFLDIMKEFKSQSIDTPGVISRVSALFKGHPDLIVGFNTFLPPGYKIEVSLTDINTVNVCAPTGTTTHVISGNGLIAAPQPPPPPPQPQSKVSSSHTASTTVTMSSTVPLITTAAASLPKSPSRPSSLPPKSSSPHVHTTPLSLGSPGVSSLQKPRGEEINDSCSPPQAQHHAINYVTKIKNRFQGQPEVYQKFLDILNNYQTEQKAIKENAVDQYGRPLQEQDVFKREGKLASEVYQQVAKLFNKQEDLLQEFSQFLPDATGSSFNANAASLSSTVAIDTKYPNLAKKASTPTTPKAPPAKIKKTVPTSVPSTPDPIKTEPVETDNKDNVDKQNRKRHKSALKDVSLAEAIKHGNFSDFSFFEKVRKALKSPEVYENFLRCLVLFNHEVISRPELIQLASNFLGKFPDLFSWFKIFLGYKDHQQTETNISGFKDRGTGSELAHLEIDFASCKRSGASYRALPKSYVQPKCSGRTQLCKEVLNDTWVSLPSWSEDTQFPGTRKTQYEEYIYKCEDERFELDIVIETNLQCIRILDELQKKMNRMSVEEQQKFCIDGTLGASSDVIYRNAINRIYGDKAAEVIDGLKKTPYVAAPLILKRLRLKDEEWRHGQKQFNKIWRDQNEKYYLKSLDHQGINFKQHDLKAIRSKALIREIEQIFEERSDQIEDGNGEISGPHLTFSYENQSSLEDASSLVIHHMKRQTGFHKEEKSSIKVILLQFLQELFFAPPGELSDDEQEMEDMVDEKTGKVSGGDSNHNSDIYNLIFVNNTWYVLLRLHQMLSERLLKMHKLAVKIADNEARDKKFRREGTAEALCLKKPRTTDVEDYYPLFLDMVKNLLDGQVEPNAFEDTIRETFGVNAYISFTMDKLIQNIVRQLHNLVTDDASMKIIDYYKEEKENNATGGPATTATARGANELAYQKKAENLLVDDNCFKLYFYQDKGLTKMSMELIPSEDDQSEDQVEAEKWSEYVEKYVGNTDILPELKEHLSKKPIFLLRNAKLLQKRLAKYGPHDKEGDEEKDFGEAEAGDSETTEAEKLSYPNVYMDNKLECKILLNSYKLRYVSGTSDYMYRRNSLSKAKQTHLRINTKLHNLYENIHMSWLNENTTPEQCRDAEGWFMGSPSVEDIVPCTTHKDTVKVTGLDVNKYSVTYSKDTRPGTQMPMKQGMS